MKIFLFFLMTIALVSGQAINSQGDETGLLRGARRRTQEDLNFVSDPNFIDPGYESMDMEAAMYIPEMPKVSSTSNYDNNVMSYGDSSEYGSYGEQKEKMIDERYMNEYKTDDYVA